MNKKRKVNIKDVAAKAGVHSSTVSRVLNSETRSIVSTQVADRVLKIAKEMGYSRNPLGSGLRGGKSYTIGVLIPDLTNPLFPPIIRGIERELSKDGYIAILADSDNSLQNEEAIFHAMNSRHVDGLILATALRIDTVVDSAIEEGIPIVLVNRKVDRNDVSSVTIDDSIGIRLAINHLVELGHTQIAYIGGPTNTSTGQDRYLEFRQTLKEGKLSSSPKLIRNCDAFCEAAGYKGMRKILRSGIPFTAVVTANDLLALGCIDAIEEEGLKCPGDISITGFNDMHFIDRISPAMTTLHVSHDQIGLKAARLLLDQIKGPIQPNQMIKIEPKLVVRESTAVITAN